MNETTTQAVETPVSRVWAGLWIEPLDVLFFRDGRPFDAATRAEGGLPLPRTLAGAVRTALLRADGFDFRKFAEVVGKAPDVRTAIRQISPVPESVIDAGFRGPWIARWLPGDVQPQPLFPAPANLYRAQGTQRVLRTVKSRSSDTDWVSVIQTVSYDREQIFRADPLRDGINVPGWESGSGARRPLWRKARGKPQRVEGFVTLGGIEAFLKGGEPELRRDHLVARHQLYDFDHRVGVAIAADSLTGAEGQLFATRMISLCEHVGFFAEISWPEAEIAKLDSALSQPFPWGGEGRHVRARLARRIAWPEQVPGPGATAVYLLATPGVFRTTDQPGPLDPDRLLAAGARIVASASTGAVAFSGWDVARKVPRPTRFAAPAGSVYFAQNSNVPGRASLCDDEELVAEGWGFALRGVLAHDR